MLTHLVVLPYLLLTTPMSMLPPHGHTIRVETPAYVGMPIWVYIECVKAEQDPPESAPKSESIFPEYPFQLHREDPNLYDLELRRNQQLVPPLRDGACRAYGLSTTTSMDTPSGRIPLHLRFRIDEPGDYEVRFIVPFAWRDDISGRTPESSKWVGFRVDVPTDAQRNEFRDRLMNAAPADPAALVGDYLSSLMIHPGTSELNLLKPYLRHKNGPVHLYAWATLDYFPDDEVQSTVLDLLREEGPIYPMARHFACRKDLYAAHVSEIAGILIDRISENPDTDTPTYAAIDAFQALRARHEVPRELQDRMNNAVRAAIPVFRERGPLPSDIVQHIASNGMTDCRPFLWESAAAPRYQEQTLICLTWMPDEQDLPRITEYILQSSRGLPGLPYHMERAYGEVALPYLKELVAKSTNIHVLRESALILARHDMREGYAYLRLALENPMASRGLEGNRQQLEIEVATLLEKELPPGGLPKYPSPYRREELIRILSARLAALPVLPARN